MIGVEARGGGREGGREWRGEGTEAMRWKGEEEDEGPGEREDEGAGDREDEGAGEREEEGAGERESVVLSFFACVRMGDDAGETDSAIFLVVSDILFLEFDPLMEGSTFVSGRESGGVSRGASCDDSCDDS